MKVQRIDHVGVIVNDLSSVKAFFLELGLRELGETEVKGKWVEQIIDLNDVKETVVMLEVPDGEAMIELVKFHFPTDDKGIQQNLPNTLGLRHIAFAVKDIEGIVAQLKKRGGELIGQVQNHEDIYKLCYIRGPEGIILELAEKIG
ncbi:VOC family protein [Tetragenococcus koreensis]|uniref:VOC family protein n=1 Tax=Tetragenococcus koreensis TaxID=290335 RepID=UPI001F2F535B|nr:VOC family protein [Tetragenococcus koreensis]MCF1616695.1 VOC family protein [Tetragenococcus koreensis]MCF1619064.1 VOC family protein [Tetragenococcus koreensis]MCF1621638.1 VOC family protein [Tetragenococcus koreensis]MCF1627016.1 VOC family protein [Tetragenococcus koreensis]MCF1656547.1 VOC family protein [Tetragenococcus koreensis]